MSSAKILIIEDDNEVSEALSQLLKQRGFNVAAARSGEEGLGFLLQGPFDLALVDYMLPHMDGIETVRRLKSQRPAMPVIMVTARAQSYDQLAGFEAGADDYIAKPFLPDVLLARINAVLRRGGQSSAPQEGSSVLTYGSLQLNKLHHSVLLDNAPLELTKTEFLLLELFMANPGRVFSRDKLLEASRDAQDLYSSGERSIDVQIMSLRRKLKSYGAAIETVRGVGYRLAEGT